ncbi:MAG: UDP-glucose 4-epimerase GalE [Anaerorhabdus sp.]
MKVLITGGAGYIGSHTTIQLLEQGHDVIIVDNLVNSSVNVLERIEEVSGKKPQFYQVDLLDKEELRKVFQDNKIDACIHFAALKAVGESVAKPLEYYRNNIVGTLTLVEVMREFKCKKMIYSSSATVYGDCETQPITEECPKGACTNPYGWTKSMLEQMLEDIAYADGEWNFIFLRYFNPIGAHETGRLGEQPSGVPANLMPYVTQVAAGQREKLSVFGSDYDTKDGTCVRDYVHVVDLAKGHGCAVERLDKMQGCEVYNLGTGKGYSVLEVIQAFEKATGITIAYELAPRREGDIAVCYADATKALKILGWKAQKDLEEMCKDSWNWQSKNPKGYEK